MKRVLTKASDVFALGITMVEVYTLQPPWAQTHDGQYMKNPQFGKFIKGSYQPFISLVHKCLEVDPHKRPTAQQVADELEGMMQQLAQHAQLIDLMCAQSGGGMPQTETPSSPVPPAPSEG